MIIVRTSVEDRRLLNPAFTGSIILRTAHGFIKEANTGLPYIYAFLVLPFILHPETRELLPNSVVTKIITWAERNTNIVTLFPRRVADLAPSTRDGLFLATTTGMARLGAVACIEPILNEKQIASYERNCGSDEVAAILKKAFFLGRWLATSGTSATVLATMGIRFESNT